MRCTIASRKARLKSVLVSTNAEIHAWAFGVREAEQTVAADKRFKEGSLRSLSLSRLQLNSGVRQRELLSVTAT